MRFAAVLLGAVLLAGCSHGASKPVPAAGVVLAADEFKLVEGYRLQKPADKQRTREYMAKVERREIRQGAWARNLTIIGVGLGVFAALGIALKVLGAL